MSEQSANAPVGRHPKFRLLIMALERQDKVCARAYVCVSLWLAHGRHGEGRLGAAL